MLTQAPRYNRSMRFWLILLGISVSVSAQKEPFTADAMMKIARISEPQLSPDGKILASAGEDQTIRIWDARSGEQLQQLTGHPGPVLSVAYAPDGAALAEEFWVRRDAELQ